MEAIELTLEDASAILRLKAGALKARIKKDAWQTVDRGGVLHVCVPGEVLAELGLSFSEPTNTQLAEVVHGEIVEHPDYSPQVEMIRFVARLLQELRRPDVEIKDRLLLSVDEAAALAGVSRATVLRAIASGELRTFSGYARGRRIRRSDLAAWVDGWK